MMTAMTPLPPDAPVMVAWATFKDSEEYQNTRKWALDSNHVDGSLWAAFLRGHMAALAAKEAELAAVVAWLNREADKIRPRRGWRFWRWYARWAVKGVLKIAAKDISRGEHLKENRHD